MKKLQEEILRSVASGTLSKESASLLMRASVRQKAADEPLAVIGMAGRWPGADDVDSLWQVLRANEFQTRAFPEARSRWMANWVGADASTPMLPGAWLDDVDTFDAAAFGISPRDVELMDPVQRLFLESSWMALRDALGDPGLLRGRPVGVFAGCCPGSDDISYWQLIQRHAPGLASIAFTGNLPSMLPGRVSHLLDLRGPSMLIDTACSSSLVAVHAACQALRARECEVAVAGGVKINLFPRAADDAIGIESQDGLTRTFAGGPGGTGIGEGVGVVVLKPLTKAIADGDRIHAVIAGSACNQDGRTAGLTVPSVAAQQAVLEAAWRAAGIGAADIGCIEAHGTGTRLGDPIEFEALARAFRAVADRGSRCAIGSAKTVFGHLDSAAGITGLIKAVLMVRHREIAPSLHFTSPNETIDYLGAPLHVNDRLTAWPSYAGAYCGVSAFSMAGTNCHVVVGPAPAHTPTPRQATDGHLRRQRHWFAARPVEMTVPLRAEPPAAADAVTRVWTELLGPNAVAEDADFFLSGGDSLKAAVLASRLARELQCAVSVSQLWRTPTLAALRTALQDSGGTRQVALPAFERRDRYALTPAQKQMMLHSVVHRDTLYNMPFGLLLNGPIHAERLCRCASAVAEADAGLRVRFAMQGGQAVMLPSNGPSLEIDCIDIDAEAALGQATADFIRPFDIQAGPLARLRLVRLSSQRAWLLMDFHHLIMDGVSVAVFVQRLAEACRDGDEGTAVPPARTALDQVQWFASRVDAGEFASHREHWRQRFETRTPGRIAALQPAGRPEVAGARLNLTLEQGMSAAVMDFARRSGIGLFATVLGAFSLALHGVSGQPSFSIGTPFSGRLHDGTEDVLGMFVNLLPMAIDIDPGAPLREWLGTLRSGLAECLDVQDGPIDLIAPDPGPLRDALGFNVAFALQNMALGEFELDIGLRAAPLPFYELPWNVAKFDLTLFAMEVGDRLVLSFERRIGGLAAAELAGLADQVVALLGRITADQTTHLSDLLPQANPAPASRPVLHF